MVHACYNKTTGGIRVADASVPNHKACTTGENPLNWNGVGGITMGANVDSWSNLEGGNQALWAKRVAKGDYIVACNRDVSSCVATASAGTTRGGQPTYLATPIIGIDHNEATYELEIDWQIPGDLKFNWSDPTDTDFHVMVVC